MKRQIFGDTSGQDLNLFTVDLSVRNQTEMEKRKNIAQTQILDQKIA